MAASSLCFRLPCGHSCCVRLPAGNAGSAAAVLALVVCTGCPAGVSRVEAPAFDPQAAAAKAMDLYDTDGSGTLAGRELDACPGLKSALASMDQDADQALSEQEIADRIGRIVESKVGAIQVACVVLQRGRPVPGVQVRFVPESFLEGVIRPAEGTTAPDGMGIATLKSETGETGGIQPGFYKVELSRQVQGRETIAARLNERTILGSEISQDNPALLEGVLRFAID